MGQHTPEQPGIYLLYGDQSAGVVLTGYEMIRGDAREVADVSR